MIEYGLTKKKLLPPGMKRKFIVYVHRLIIMYKFLLEEGAKVDHQTK